MGAGSSKVQVHVRADKPYYYTGDVVTGSVVFHTEQPITFHKINIKVNLNCVWQATNSSVLLACHQTSTTRRSSLFSTCH